jgi:hypothetical protein
MVLWADGELPHITSESVAPNDKPHCAGLYCTVWDSNMQSKNSFKNNSWLVMSPDDQPKQT